MLHEGQLQAMMEAAFQEEPGSSLSITIFIAWICICLVILILVLSCILAVMIKYTKRKQIKEIEKRNENNIHNGIHKSVNENSKNKFDDEKI